MACAPNRPLRRRPPGMRWRATASKARSSPGPAPSRGPACRRRRGSRATGCCATNAVGAASCTCCSRHHADDQAETVAMRAARRSGPDGLAGMAALVDQPEVRLLRPLLAVSRARLTATLLARGVQWLDDPSNVDPRFERARLRASGSPASRAFGRRGGERAVRDGDLARAAVDMLAFDQAGTAAIDQAGFAAPGPGSAGEAAQPGRSGGGRAGLSAAPRASGAGGRRGFAHRPGARKVGQRAGFHAFRLPAHAASGTAAAGACTGLSGPNMAGT